MCEGYKLYKWKGPQEHQPATHSEFLAAHKRIQDSPQTSENIKKVFDLLARVIEDISQNDPAQRMIAKMTKGNKKEQKPITENMKNRGKYLTNLDKVNILYFSDYEDKNILGNNYARDRERWTEIRFIGGVLSKE